LGFGPLIGEPYLDDPVNSYAHPKIFSHFKNNYSEELFKPDCYDWPLQSGMNVLISSERRTRAPLKSRPPNRLRLEVQHSRGFDRAKMASHNSQYTPLPPSNINAPTRSRPNVRQRDSNQRSDPGTKDILLAVGLVSIPLISLSALLLGIVYFRRVSPPPNSSSMNPLLSSVRVVSSYNDAFYIKLSPTTFVLLSSFSSSIVPSLVGFLMVLLSFSISRYLLDTSELGKRNALPTPYQLGLLLKILNGEIGGLWDWIKYSLWWRVRSKGAGILKTSAFSLTLAYFFVYAPLCRWLSTIES